MYQNGVPVFIFQIISGKCSIILDRGNKNLNRKRNFLKQSLVVVVKQCHLDANGLFIILVNSSWCKRFKVATYGFKQCSQALRTKMARALNPCMYTHDSAKTINNITWLLKSKEVQERIREHEFFQNVKTHAC